MITQDTVAAIWTAYREIAASEAELAEANERARIELSAAPDLGG